MADYSKLSDSELEALYNKARAQPTDPAMLSTAQLDKAYNAAKAAQRGPMERAKDAWSALDVGFAESAAGLAALPRTIAEGGKALTDMQRRELGLKPPPGEQPPLAMSWPSEKETSKFIQDRTYGGAAPYEPKDEFEKILKTGGGFLAGSAAPGGWFARMMRTLTPTVTTEVGGRVGGEEFGRPIGALIGGGVQSGGETLAARPQTGRQMLQHHLPEGTTPAHVDAATELMLRSHEQGYGPPLTWGQSLSQVQQRPVLTDIERHLEASPKSAPRMAEFYADRPQRTQEAVQRQAQEISPGPPTNPDDLGVAVQTQAGSILDTQRRQINAQADPHYHAASLMTVDPAEMAYLQSLRGWDEAVAAINRRSQLNPQRYPENSVGFVNEVKQYMGGAAEHASSPFRQEARSVTEPGGWRADEAAARDVALRTSAAQTPPGSISPYAEALRIETDLRTRVLGPLERGPLGALADAKPDIGEAVNILFPKDPTKIHGEAAVGEAMRRIAAVSPKLADDALRAHLEIAWDRASRKLQSGPNQQSGARLSVLMGGTEQQRRNIRAAFEALPNGAERYEGFRRFDEVLEASGTRKNIGSGTTYNTELTKDFGKNSLMADVAETAAKPMSGGKPFVERYKDWKLGKNLNELAGLVIDPRTSGLLRQIAASPRGGPREANVIKALIYSQQLKPSAEAGKEVK